MTEIAAKAFHAHALSLDLLFDFESDRQRIEFHSGTPFSDEG